jgi:hypothetical protein
MLGAWRADRQQSSARGGSSFTEGVQERQNGAAVLQAKERYQMQAGGAIEPVRGVCSCRLLLGQPARRCRDWAGSCKHTEHWYVCQRARIQHCRHDRHEVVWLHACAQHCRMQCCTKHIVASSARKWCAVLQHGVCRARTEDGEDRSHTLAALGRQHWGQSCGHEGRHAERGGSLLYLSMCRQWRWSEKSCRGTLGPITRLVLLQLCCDRAAWRCWHHKGHQCDRGAWMCCLCHHSCLLLPRAFHGGFMSFLTGPAATATMNQIAPSATRIHLLPTKRQINSHRIQTRRNPSQYQQPPTPGLCLDVAATWPLRGTGAIGPQLAW